MTLSQCIKKQPMLMQNVIAHVFFVFTLICIFPMQATSHPYPASPKHPAQPHVLAVTEELPPFNYTENDTVVGLSTEIIMHLLESAGYTYDIKVYPWQRALWTVKTQPNSMLFSTVKTPERLNYFYWIGPIATIKVDFYSLPGTNGPTVRSFEELKRYRICVPSGALPHERLLELGFKESEDFIAASTLPQCFRMLFHGRVDVIPAYPFSLKHFAENMNLLDVQFKLIFPLAQRRLYLAINKDSDPELIKRLSATFTEMKQQGIVSSITERHHQ